jgi:hypothetical protein
MMMFIEREVEASFKFLSFHFGRMNIAQKFLQEEGKMWLQFQKKHPRWHQCVEIGGLNFDTSTRPLTNK